MVAVPSSVWFTVFCLRGCDASRVTSRTRTPRAEENRKIRRIDRAVAVEIASALRSRGRLDSYDVAGASRFLLKGRRRRRRDVAKEDNNGLIEDTHLQTPFAMKNSAIFSSRGAVAKGALSDCAGDRSDFGHTDRRARRISPLASVQHPHEPFAGRSRRLFGQAFVCAGRGWRCSSWSAVARTRRTLPSSGLPKLRTTNFRPIAFACRPMTLVLLRRTPRVRRRAH